MNFLKSIQHKKDVRIRRKNLLKSLGLAKTNNDIIEIVEYYFKYNPNYDMLMKILKDDAYMYKNYHIKKCKDGFWRLTVRYYNMSCPHNLLETKMYF